MGGLCGGNDFRLRHFAHLAVSDIGGNRVIEQYHFLADQRDVGAQAGQREIDEIMTVQCDATAAGQVKARNQICQRGLAAAGCAHQRDGLPCGNFQADVAQCQPVILLVGQVHVLESYPAVGAPYGNFTGVDFTGCIKQPEYAFRCRQPTLQKFTDTGQAFDRGGQHQHGCDKRKETADGGLIAARLHRGKIDDDGQCHGGDHLHDGHIGCGCHRLFHDVAAHPVGFIAKTVALVLLSAKQLDHFVRGNAFLDHLGDIAHRVLRTAAGIAQPGVDDFQDERNDRQHHQTEQRELPVEIEQPAEQPDDDD